MEIVIFERSEWRSFYKPILRMWIKKIKYRKRLLSDALREKWRKKITWAEHNSRKKSQWKWTKHENVFCRWKSKKTKDRVKTLVLADSRFDTDFHFQSNLYYNAMIASKCSFFSITKRKHINFHQHFIHYIIELRKTPTCMYVCVWSALMKLKNRSHHKISVLKKSTSPFIYQNELREITSI